MSKKSRHTDNSKRQQPVQQQRAEAARQVTGSGKQANDKRSTKAPGTAESRSTKE